MSLARTFSRAAVGVTAPEICIEVHLSGGLPSLCIVGLPEASVREARDRVRSALLNAGFQFPQRRTTIALAPASLPKSGGRYDLAMAVGILAASKQLDAARLSSTEFVGELSLGGELRSVSGLLSAVVRARDCNRTVVIPSACGPEAALVKEAHVLVADTLLDVVGWINGAHELPTAQIGERMLPDSEPDLADVVGQDRARRALEIAAAGGHNLLYVGPPGTGKTMLAERLSSILPPLTDVEALETAAVASVSRGGLDPATWARRPFRAPHHTASGAALVGGGAIPRPGEVSLAHNGVLFLDELPEFKRSVLEVLREPLESGTIAISRVAQQVVFPARFQLVAAMNPCPCGYLGEVSGRCHCSPDRIQRYRGRISGPLLDRMDLHVELPRPRRSLLAAPETPPESSSEVRRRVVAARRRQLCRHAALNSQLDAPHREPSCRLSKIQARWLDWISGQLEISPRGLLRIIRVSRTIADLEGSDDIGDLHLAEAASLRNPGSMAGDGTDPRRVPPTAGQSADELETFGLS